MTDDSDYKSRPAKVLDGDFLREDNLGSRNPPALRATSFFK